MMTVSVSLTPNEVAALAETSETVVEKAPEQNGLGVLESGRLMPLQAVALAAAANSLGRRLTVSDKKKVAREISAMSATDLKTAEIEIAPSMIIRLGELSRDAVGRAERYAAARDAYIETTEGVQGGRPVIRGTRLTVSAIHGRLSSGDTFDDLAGDYPDVPREAFEAAFVYGKSHPMLGRPARRRGTKTA